MLRTKTVMGLLLIVVLGAMASTAWAQNQTDVFDVAYYYTGSASLPTSQPVVDGVVNIINPGWGATAAGLTSGQGICADIYVFDKNEELKECCSCFVSADGLLSIHLFQLTNNPQNKVYANTGVIKIISDNQSPTDPFCGERNSPTFGYPFYPGNALNPTPGPELRSWIVNPDTSITENRFEDAPLSANELTALKNGCNTIPNQSGSGVCFCGSNVE